VRIQAVGEVVAPKAINAVFLSDDVRPFPGIEEWAQTERMIDVAMGVDGGMER